MHGMMLDYAVQTKLLMRNASGFQGQLKWFRGELEWVSVSVIGRGSDALTLKGCCSTDLGLCSS